MPDSITLTCISCGIKLEIPNDIERFACGNCGVEQIVKRTGSIVSLAPVSEGLTQIRVGVDKTASELAIQRLKDEIRNLDSQIRSIRFDLGKKHYYKVQDALRNIRKNRGFKYCWLALNAPDIVPDEFVGITLEESRQIARYFSTANLASGEKQAILNAMDKIRILEEAISDKLAQISKHQQIVNQ
jgi:hypothetical protein